MGATITRTRRLEWTDTDAAGLWHHTTVWRFAEWLEAEMHRELGITEVTFGWTPRRRVEAEFLRPVVFDQELECTMNVRRIGTTSATYEFELGDLDGPVARAELVCVLVDEVGRRRTWPEHVRLALGTGRPVDHADTSAMTAT